MSDQDFNDGLFAGIALIVVGGLAVYGAKKLIDKVTTSQDQKLLEPYVRDLKPPEHWNPAGCDHGTS